MPTLLDVAWLTLCGILVFIMQAGFLCLEAGATRSKNRINVVIKNLADLGLSVIIFWVVGYGIMFGRSWHGIIGHTLFAPNFGDTQDAWKSSFFFFQAMFCSTAVTILSGAAAERIRFKLYLAITVLISGLVYPMVGHWVWHGLGENQTSGWLAQKGFVDFAGSTVVHSVGGWCALAAILVLGPRLGRFSSKRHFGETASADLPLAFLGTMLLWFGWFGFNGGSNLAFDATVSRIITNTLMAGAAGLVMPIVVMELRQQPIKSKPTLNGALAGLVAITSGCHAYSTAIALLVGAIGSLLMMLASWLLEKWKIDDVVDAIPVHLVSGMWGTLAVGIFGNLTQLGTGLDRFSQLKVQVAGILACGLWAFSITLVGLLILQRYLSLRVSPRQEYVGLNISEHGSKSDIQDVYSVMKHHATTGELGRRVKIDQFTEIGQVGRWYNQVIAALETAVATNDAIINTAIDGIITVSQRNLTIQSANPATALLFGYDIDQLSDLPLQQLFTNAISQSLLSEMAQAASPQPLMGHRRNGTTFPLEATTTLFTIGSERFGTIFIRDISARQQTEQALLNSRLEACAKADALEVALNQLKQTAQVIQRERMAGQRQLVAGIAHEINNPVGFIHSNLNHAKGYIEDLLFAVEQYRQHGAELSEQSRSHIESELEAIDLDYIAADFPKLMASMRTGSERIRTIVKQLRTFSRHDESELKAIDLHESIDSALTLLEHRFKATDHRAEITIKRRYSDLPSVECYASLLNRAIFNLVDNAIEAFDRAAPSTAAPYITLHTRRHKDQVILAIINNGPPIPSEYQKRIFDPFFTTQPIGKGTGLGCTLSYQIVVEQHHGRLSCHSSPGCETCFVIELPLRQTAATATQESLTKRGAVTDATKLSTAT